MPTGPKRPQHEIDRFVKRFLAGEQAVALAKEARVSKPGFYLWVAKYKRDLLEKSKRSGMNQHDAETADKRTLIIELEQLRAENRKLRDRVLDMMVKYE